MHYIHINHSTVGIGGNFACYAHISLGYDRLRWCQLATIRQHPTGTQIDRISTKHWPKGDVEKPQLTQSDRENIFWPWQTLSMHKNRLRQATIAFWPSTNPHQPNCIAMWRKSNWIATPIDVTQTLSNPACPSVFFRLGQQCVSLRWCYVTIGCSELTFGHIQSANNVRDSHALPGGVRHGSPFGHAASACASVTSMFGQLGL